MTRDEFRSSHATWVGCPNCNNCRQCSDHTSRLMGEVERLWAELDARDNLIRKLGHRIHTGPTQ